MTSTAPSASPQSHGQGTPPASVSTTRSRVGVGCSTGARCAFAAEPAAIPHVAMMIPHDRVTFDILMTSFVNQAAPRRRYNNMPTASVVV